VGPSSPAVGLGLPDTGPLVWSTRPPRAGRLLGLVPPPMVSHYGTGFHHLGAEDAAFFEFAFELEDLGDGERPAVEQRSAPVGEVAG
jgi:hypothetical protein